MALWRYSWRHLRQKRGRSLLTLTGVVLGVAAVVGVGIALDTARTAHRSMFEGLAGRAGLEISAAGRSQFKATDVARACELDAVQSCVPMLRMAAGVVAHSGVMPVLLVGIDPAADHAARRLPVSAGRPLSEVDGVLLDAAFASAAGLSIGDEARLLTRTGVQELSVAGLLAPGGATAFNAGAVAYVRLSTAQRLFAAGEQVNAMQLVLADGAEVAAIEPLVQERLPAGFRVERPAEQAALVAPMLTSTEHGMSAISVVSMVAGACVILNTLLMSTGERRRDFAILQAVGATIGQIRTMVLRESAAMGIVGTALGIPLGMLVALGLARSVEKAIGANFAELRFTPLPFVTALLLGPGVCLLAAWLAMCTAARQSPLAGLTGSAELRNLRPARWPGILGGALFALMVAFVAALRFNAIPPAWIAVSVPMGMAIICSSIALLAAAATPALLRACEGSFARAMGPEATLGVRQLRRHPTRTSLTVAVVAISVMVAIGFGSSIRASTRDIERWADRISQVDFFVRGTFPDPATMSLALPLSPQIGDALKKLPGAGRVRRINFATIMAAGMPAALIAADFPPDAPVPIDLRAGDAASIARRLHAGDVVIGSGLARESGLTIGDRVRLQTKAGPKDVEIAGVATEYTSGGRNLTMDWQAAQRLVEFEGVHVFSVDAAGESGDARRESLAALTPALEQFCIEHSLTLQSRAGFSAMVHDYLRDITASMIMIVGMVFLVSLLGIVNTLSMGVLEQTREIGMLRAVAMQRGQIARSTLAQAAAVGMMGMAPGLAGGLAMAYAMNVSTYPITGFLVEFTLSPLLIGLILTASLVVAALGAWPAARRASRITVIEALRYE